ncbi:MAG: SnoaL-like domain-containing protein [Saprospiraceae bacterium]
MTTTEVANRLIELCQSGKWEAAQNELYAEDCVSIELPGSPNEITKGLANIKKKGEQWDQMVEEVHGNKIEGPIVADNHFSLSMALDVTFKGMPRMTTSEVCVYEVTNGKITKEQFFYAPPPEQ